MPTQAEIDRAKRRVREAADAALARRIQGEARSAVALSKINPTARSNAVDAVQGVAAQSSFRTEALPQRRAPVPQARPARVPQARPEDTVLPFNSGADPRQPQARPSRVPQHRPDSLASTSEEGARIVANFRKAGMPTRLAAKKQVVKKAAAPKPAKKPIVSAPIKRERITNNAESAFEFARQGQAYLRRKKNA